MIDFTLNVSCSIIIHAIFPMIDSSRSVDRLYIVCLMFDYNTCNILDDRLKYV